MMRMRLKLSGEKASLVAKALMPDNIEGMRTVLEENSASISFETSKLSSAIAVADDLILNAKVAFEILALASESEKKAGRSSHRNKLKFEDFKGNTCKSRLKRKTGKC